MTERSRPWDGTTVGDAFEAPYDAATEWARIMRATSFGSEITVNKGGVLMDASGFNDFSVTTPLANTARVQSGLGLNQGTWYESDANIDFNIPTPAVSTRIDRIVLRKSWANQTVRMTRIAGVEGAGVPAITQSFGVTWDVPLWQVSIVITTGTITYLDERRSIGAGHAHLISPTIDSGSLSTPAGAISIASLAAVAFTGFTPTVNQNGLLTTSSAIGRYFQIGKLVVATVQLTLSSTGTGGIAIIVGGLPVAAASNQGSPCWGFFQHSGGPFYDLAGIWASTTTVQFVASNAGGAAPTGVWGVSPGTSLVSGDFIYLTFVYEAL